MVGTLTSVSLHRGVTSLTNRLGADLIVAPHGYKGTVKGVLLTGKPSDVYMPPDSLSKLKRFDFIDTASPQLYITTMKASCCSYPVQLIGFDEETDFIVKPWLEQVYHGRLAEDEVIIGDKVPSAVGEEVRYLGKTMRIVGKLERTGIGFDACVFMDMDTARELALSSQRLKMSYDAEKHDLVSIIMVKLKPGTDAEKAARTITEELKEDKMYGFNSKSFAGPIAANLRILSGYIKFTLVLLWVVAAIVLAMIFSVIVNERKKEMNILRVIGATRGKLLGLILREAAIISAFGAVLGVGVGGFISFIVLPKMSEVLSIPYLIPEWGSLLLYAGACLLIGVLTGPVASLYAGVKVARRDAYTSTRGM
ncbi:MAG: ABC transporter permease [Eubacteriales bacterium]|nr:ABC transporter permease [Eubacteriales bacterium]